VRTICVLTAIVLTACGNSVASAAKPTPTPSPNVGAMYTNAINTLHDSTATDRPAFFATKPGSTEESSAATKLAGDFESLLTSLDAIPFPTDASADLSAFKKAVVACQVFWSNVSISDANYSVFTDNATNDAYNQTGILLGHDVGVTLVIQKPSPSPSS
jgi:hypothetical protein